MVYTYRHREAVLGRTTHSYSTLAAVGGGVRALVIEMTVNLTNAYYVASTLYRRLPPVIRDLRAEPTGLFKRLITTWLRMIGSDNAVSPHSHLPLLTTLYYNYFQLLCRRVSICNMFNRLPRYFCFRNFYFILFCGTDCVS
ncbi:hypothetical protein J6590_080064 [Homalodisca vitripennis]|nr:hypothetical protein J6590_080064 [Homalodisca vitripennis]